MLLMNWLYHVLALGTSAQTTHTMGPQEYAKPITYNAQNKITPIPMPFLVASGSTAFITVQGTNAINIRMAPENKIKTRPQRSTVKIVMKVEKKLTTFSANE